MKTKKNRKLKGSVLLTVVMVMALLILFLFGTLALATAANNRAHVNYSTSQTGITSRMVIDTVGRTLSDVSGDPEIEAMKNAVAALDASSGPLSIPVSISSNSTNVNTFGDIDSLTAEYVGVKKFYNHDKGAWDDYDVVKLTATVTMNGVTSNSVAYFVKDPPSPAPGGGGGGAGFVTTGGAGFACQTNLFGGSYINLPNSSTVAGYDYLAGYGTYSGNYLSHETFSFPNTGSLMESDVVINGDLFTHQLEHMVFPGAGQGITIWGDMTYSDNSATHMTTHSNLKNSAISNIEFNKIPYVYVDGELFGAIKMGPQSADPDQAFPFNVFAGNLVVKNVQNGGIKTNDAANQGTSIGGDLYLMNPDKDNIIKSTGATKLYSWTTSVITRHGASVTNLVQGNIYSKGNFIIEQAQNGFSAAGLYCEKDITIGTTNGEKANLSITGDIVCQGTLKINKTNNPSDFNVGGHIYCDTIDYSAIESDPSFATIKNTIDSKKEPFSSFTGSVYPDYAERSVIIGKSTLSGIPKENSQVVMTMDEVLTNVIDPYANDNLPTALQSTYNTITSGNAHVVQNNADIMNSAKTGYQVCTSWWDSTNNKVSMNYASSGAGWPVITDSCVLKCSFSNGSYADPSSSTGNPFKQLNGYDSYKKAVVFNPGAGEMLVVLDGFSMDNSVNLIVDDSQGGTVYFYVNPATTAHFEGTVVTTKYLDMLMKLKDGTAPLAAGFQVYTNPAYKINNGAAEFNDPALHLSIPATDNKYAPGLKIYGGVNSEITWSNFEVLTGQIVSPNVKLTVSATSNAICDNKDIYYNGYKVPTNYKCIIGCCNSKETSFPNQINVIYIPEGGGGGTPTPVPGVTSWFKMMYYDEY